MADVLKFPEPLRCSKCKEVIPKGARYINARLPDGESTTPVCTTCMHKQTTVGDKDSR